MGLGWDDCGFALPTHPHSSSTSTQCWPWYVGWVLVHSSSKVYESIKKKKEGLECELLTGINKDVLLLCLSRHKLFSDTHYHFYANDIQLYMSFKVQQVDSPLFSDWFSNNDLVLNWS